MVNEEAIKKSFLKIKEDMENLKQENDLLHQDLARLKTEIYDDSFIEKLADSLMQKINKKSDKEEVEPKQVLEEKTEIIAKETKIPNDVDLNIFKKQKVKKKIVDLCRNKIAPCVLKGLIVDKYNICSRATFYRYVKELKKSGYLQTVELNDEAFLIATDSIINRNIYK